MKETNEVLEQEIKEDAEAALIDAELVEVEKKGVFKKAIDRIKNPQTKVGKVAKKAAIPVLAGGAILAYAFVKGRNNDEELDEDDEYDADFDTEETSESEE